MKLNHLYEEKGAIHNCEGARIHDGVYLVWSLCGRDVPENKSFKSKETATCPRCEEIRKAGGKNGKS